MEKREYMDEKIMDYINYLRMTTEAEDNPEEPTGGGAPEAFGKTDAIGSD